jgi:hypothetical protein
MAVQIGRDLQLAAPAELMPLVIGAAGRSDGAIRLPQVSSIGVLACELSLARACESG